MRVRVNGKEIDVTPGLTLRGLVEELGLAEGPVAIEVNREIVVRAEHATRAVKAGDEIEIVHFVGGG